MLNWYSHYIRNLICWIGMENNMAGHKYQGLHGCWNVNESVENY